VPITIEYYQAYSVASMKLSWSSPSTPKQVVPTTRLYTSATSATALSLAASSISLFSEKPVKTDSTDPMTTI